MDRTASMPAACGCARSMAPEDAGCCRRGAARRPCQVRRRPRLARPRHEHRPIERRLGGQLDRAPVGTGFPDWKKAVVLSKGGGVASIGFANGSTGYPAGLGAQRCPSAASAERRSITSTPGMIIIVKEMAPGSYALRSIPEISGGMHRRGSPHRPGPGHAGRLRRHRVELQSRDPGASPARLGVQADRLCDRARERHDPGVDHRRCAVLRLAGRRPRQQMLPQLRQAAMPARTPCAGVSSSRAT